MLRYWKYTNRAKDGKLDAEKVFGSVAQVSGRVHYFGEQGRGYLEEIASRGGPSHGEGVKESRRRSARHVRHVSSYICAHIINHATNQE